MKTWKTISFCIAVSSFVIMGCGAPSSPPSAGPTAGDLMAAASELDSLFLVAFNTGDAESLMRLYWNSPDLRAYPPGEMQQNGYEAVKAAMTKEFAMNKGAKLEYLNTNNLVFAGGVVGHGTFRWTLPMEGGAPMVMEGRYMEVKEMKDGRMVITVDHTSAPMAPPEEMSKDSTAHQ